MKIILFGKLIDISFCQKPLITLKTLAYFKKIIKQDKKCVFRDFYKKTIHTSDLGAFRDLNKH